jgi:hypothetical protein
MNTQGVGLVLHAAEETQHCTVAGTLWFFKPPDSCKTGSGIGKIFNPRVAIAVAPLAAALAAVADSLHIARSTFAHREQQA